MLENTFYRRILGGQKGEFVDDEDCPLFGAALFFDKGQGFFPNSGKALNNHLYNVPVQFGKNLPDSVHRSFPGREKDTSMGLSEFL